MFNAGDDEEEEEESFVSVLSAAATSDAWYSLSACGHISQRESA